MNLALRLRQAGLAVLLVFLSACSIYQMPGEQPVPVEGEPEYTEVPSTSPTPVETPPREQEPEVSAAYGSLLAKAGAATARGDYEQALALLERAQRIDPDNAQIYLDMARTHNEAGNSRQAAATAQRGLLYCIGREQCDALREFLL